MAPIIFHLGTTRSVVSLTPWSEKRPKFCRRHSRPGRWVMTPQAPSHTSPRYVPQTHEPPRGVINTSKHFNGRFCCRSLKITIPCSSCLQNMKHYIVCIINIGSLFNRYKNENVSCLQIQHKYSYHFYW
jgi:hypothetical protein